MKTILYIHGFNSAGASAKAQALAQHYKGKYKVLTPTFNYKDLKATLKLLNSLFITNKIELVVGTSMGGFLALYGSCKYKTKCVAINPTTKPSESLQFALGENKNYVTKERYMLLESDLLPYREFEENEFSKIEPTDERCRFLLSEDDELLGDHHYLEDLFPKCNHFKYFKGFGHRFDSPKAIRAAIDELMG